MSVFGDGVRTRRLALGWSQRDLARAAHLDASYIPRIESGQRIPTAPIAAALDQALGAGGALAALLPQPAPPGPARLDAADVPRLRALIGDLVRADIAAGADAVVRRAGREWRQAHAALAAGRYPETCRRDLHAAIGELGEVVGWLLFDAGRPDAARRALTDALLVSQLAGDTAMEQLQLSLLAMVAQQTGRYAEARGLAERGLALCPPGGRVEAMHRLRLGRALASLGSTDGVRELDRAAVLLDHPRGDEPEWVWWMTPAEVTLHRGQAAGSVGNRTAAIDLTRAAVDLLPAAQPRDRGAYLLRHVRVSVAAGAWEAARQATAELVDVLGRVRSGRLVSDARHALAEAERAGAPAGVVNGLHVAASE